MKKVILIVIALAIVLVIVFFLKRKQRDTSDRLVLNGLNRDEFLKTMRIDWKKKYWDVMINDYLVFKGDFAYYEVDGKVIKKALGGSWSADIYNESVKTGTPISELKEYATQTSWDKENSSPLNVQWAVNQWLPKAVDNLGIDYNKKLVQELIKKI